MLIFKTFKRKAQQQQQQNKKLKNQHFKVIKKKNPSLKESVCV